MNPKYLNLLFSLALIAAMIPLKDLPLRYLVPLATLEILVFAAVGNWIVEKISNNTPSK